MATADSTIEGSSAFPEAKLEARAGVLDGLTIARFVRCYSGGAGLEYDVEILNRALCERNRIHIVQIQMAQPGESMAVDVRAVGRGRITSIPLERETLPVSRESADSSHCTRSFRGLKTFIRDRLIFGPLFENVSLKVLHRRRPAWRSGDVVGVGASMSAVLDSEDISLVMVHAGGGLDAWEAIEAASHAGVPCGMQLHFANSKFCDLSVRSQAMRVQAVAGVSEIDVPAYLGSRFHVLYTAVDTTFFSPSASSPGRNAFSRPVLVLPARIVPTKGHDDVITAVIDLQDRGVEVDVVFAGRCDQPAYEEHLRQKICRAGLDSRFHFPGLLNQSEIREVYRSAAILAFPTYHEEGLPRILLEAQAMEVPVVAYDSGGSRAGLVDGKTGFLLRVGDVAGFAGRLNTLLENRGLAQRMGKEGRRWVKTMFSPAALAERHERFYLQMIAHGRHHS